MDHFRVGHRRAPEVAGVEGDVELGSKVVQQRGQATGGGGAEHVEVGADEHGVCVVLGQPGGEAPVAVADTVGRSRVKRRDRHLERVEQRALPA